MRQSFKELKDNLLYLLKLVWGYDKSLFAVFAAFSISGAALSYIEIYVPKILLGSLIQESPMDRLLVQVGLLSLAILAVTLVKSWTGNRYQCKCGLVRSDLCLNLLTVKRFRIRYRYMEDPKTADSLERAKYISWSSNVGIEAALNNLQAFARGAILLAAVIAGEGVLGLLVQELQKRQNVESIKVNRRMEMNVSLAMADVPYARLEDKEFLDFRQTYLSGLSRSTQIAYVMVRAFHIGTCLLALVGYAALLIRLLATDRAGVPSGMAAVDFLVSNTWIWLLAIAGMSVYSSYLKVKADNMYTKMVEEFAPTERAYAYYQKLSRNQVCAKDIRLFRFYPLLSAYMEDYRKAARKLEIRFSNATLWRAAPADICLKVQTLLIYILVAMKVSVKMITFGQFYMYANVIRNTIGALSDMLDDITGVRYAFGFHYAYQVLVEAGTACTGGSMETTAGQTEKSVVPDGTAFMSLEFEDVWFRYPGSEAWVLQGFSGKIEAGQRVSIVGMNGAGKTTLIKLLHRFYQPERGRILVNGIDISSYPYEDYWKMFSTVFQDVHYFAYSVGENVAASADMVPERVDQVLGQVGLTEMLSRHKGHDTELTRDFSEEGVILSGGEAQKLAVARAFYRDAPIYVFDEPTAALDPLAEKEIVDCFDGHTQGKTVIYISHRMASCRNSDKIFVVDKGCLAECGTHEQLVAAEGIYWQLWSAQAQWYGRPGEMPIFHERKAH